jgi:ABC-type molybdate transport system substrate-binding protein
MLRLIFAGLMLAAVGLTGCGDKGGNPPLTVLAGSELTYLKPLLPSIEKEAGVRLSVTYGGTLETTEKIDQGEPAELAWLSQGKSLGGREPAGKRGQAQE